MRFNDEVDFTLLCVRVPDPVVAEKPAAKPSMFIDCMTQGDVKGAAHLRGTVTAVYAKTSPKQLSEVALEQCIDEIKAATKPRAEVFAKGGTVEKILDAVLPKAVWEKYDDEYTAAFNDCAAQGVSFKRVVYDDVEINSGSEAVHYDGSRVGHVDPLPQMTFEQAQQAMQQNRERMLEARKNYVSPTRESMIKQRMAECAQAMMCGDSRDALRFEQEFKALAKELRYRGLTAYQAGPHRPYDPRHW